MRYFTLFFALIICCSAVSAEGAAEFGEWYGVYDNFDQKMLVVYSGEEDTSLIVYVDEQLITRLKFEPPKQIALATFDHREYKNMNYDSLFGYDPWVKRMVKHYRLQIWFVGQEKYEEFSLKGFSKAIRWLHE